MAFVTLQQAHTGAWCAIINKTTDSQFYYETHSFCVLIAQFQQSAMNSEWTAATEPPNGAARKSADTKWSIILGDVCKMDERESFSIKLISVNQSVIDWKHVLTV